MAKGLTTQELDNARVCVEVLHAVQKGSKTPGWYRGEVRGKESVGIATTTLLQGGFIASANGATPFRLTTKGKEFVTSEVKEWDSFLAKIGRPATLEKVAKALRRV